MTEYLLSVGSYLEKTAGIGVGGVAGAIVNGLQTAKGPEVGPTVFERIVGNAEKFINKYPGWSAGIASLPLLAGAGYLGYHMLQKKNQERAQDKAFAQVSNLDPVLSEASKEELNTAFQTMRNFAPTLATDPNAVQSFLRSAVMSGGGVDYNTIKLLAETENAATGRFHKE